MHKKGHIKRCPKCGFDEHISSILYILNQELSESIYYWNYSRSRWIWYYISWFRSTITKKVAIKEYLPATLATRNVITATVIPLKKQENTFRFTTVH